VRDAAARDAAAAASHTTDVSAAVYGFFTPFSRSGKRQPLRLEDPATSASPRAGFGMPRTAEITRKTSTHPIARDGVDPAYRT
jgi:hypothetical protein